MMKVFKFKRILIYADVAGLGYAWHTTPLWTAVPLRTLLTRSWFCHNVIILNCVHSCKKQVFICIVCLYRDAVQAVRFERPASGVAANFVSAGRLTVISGMFQLLVVTYLVSKRSTRFGLHLSVLYRNGH